MYCESTECLLYNISIKKVEQGMSAPIKNIGDGMVRVYDDFIFDMIEKL